MAETGAGARYLVVNADDFGLSPGVNRGIVRAHEQGIVTSASLMVRPAAAVEAAAYARARPGLGLGLHLDFGEWAYRGGQWVSVYQVVPKGDAVAVAVEVRRQIDVFVALVGRPPTHLDSHQHVHLHEPVRSVVAERAADLNVPLRSVTRHARYCGDFYGQYGRNHPFPEGITTAALLRIIASLPPGATELACHPGEDDDLDSVYRVERRLEVAALCDPATRAALTAAAVELSSFARLPRTSAVGGVTRA
jgi:chitin disaccharide deacetylase